MEEKEQGVEKKMEEQSNQQAPADKNVQTTSDSDKESKVEENDSKKQEVDYKSELERLKEKYSQEKDLYKHDIKKLKEKAKRLKDKQEIDIDEIKDSLLGEIKDELRDELLGELDVVRQEATKTSIDSAIMKIASGDEAELTRFYYDKIINKTGDLKEDVENAWFLANKKRILSQNEELMSALSGKSMQSFGGDGGGDNIKKSDGPKLSDADKTLLKRAGLLEDVMSGKIKI